MERIVCIHIFQKQFYTFFLVDLLPSVAKEATLERDEEAQLLTTPLLDNYSLSNSISIKSIAKWKDNQEAKPSVHPTIYLQLSLPSSSPS